MAGTKTAVLKLLQERKGEYLSGEELSRRLSVSRAAVWKSVKSLREEGYSIHAVTNRGYCLAEKETDILNEFELKKYLADWPETAEKLEFFPVLSSTSLYAKTLADDPASDGKLIVAMSQTGGRGRRQRAFYSPEGGIYFSLILHPEMELSEHMYLTVAGALAACRSIRELYGLPAEIKWPNDIVCQGKKLCGILTETSVELETGRIQYAVIGTGINVNTEAFPPELARSADSIRNLTGKTACRAELAGKIVGHLRKLCRELETPQGRKAMLEEYRQDSLLIGKQVHIFGKTEEFTAEVLGIAEDGRLFVRDSSGTERLCGSGDYSVRLPES